MREHRERPTLVGRTDPSGESGFAEEASSAARAVGPGHVVAAEDASLAPRPVLRPLGQHDVPDGTDWWIYCTCDLGQCDRHPAGLG